MIAIRTWLRSRRRSVGLVLALGVVLGALVLAHSGGESQTMSDHASEMTLALCLAVLDGGIAAALIFASFSRRRPPQSLGAVARQSTRRPLPRAWQRPPARAGPARLQVFLR